MCNKLKKNDRLQGIAVKHLHYLKSSGYSEEGYCMNDAEVMESSSSQP